MSASLLGSLVAQLAPTIQPAHRTRERLPRPHGVPTASYQARQAAAAEARTVRPPRFEEMVALLNADGRRMPTAQHRARRDQRARRLAELLEYLRLGERDPATMAAHVGEAYSVVRNDIAVLRNAGLIDSRPFGGEGAMRFWFLPAAGSPDDPNT